MTDHSSPPWYLTLSIEAKEHSAPTAKGMIDNTSSTPGQHSDKHHQMGRASCTIAGKCHLVDRRVVGTVEGLHYGEDLWKAMTLEQKVQVLLLCKEKSTQCSVKATSTAGSGPVPMNITDQFAALICAVQSLDSNSEGKRRSSSCHNSPH